MANAEPGNEPWAVEAEAVLRSLGVDPKEGLSSDEAHARVARFGVNALEEFRPTSWWAIVWRQLRTFLVLLLLAAAVLSFALGDQLEGVAILAVIVINTMIGFVTELRAVRSTEALRSLGSTETTVRRDGSVTRLSAENLVPGDILLLEGGDIVTADARILSASRLSLDESTLTGESIPVEKGPSALPPQTILADRANMLFKGTSATKGTAEAVVVSTGMNTELGRITALVQTAPDRRTPLEERIDSLGVTMGWLCIALVVAVAILGAIGGKDTTELVKTGIALAVATVPEGLPIVATLALARGVLRMARRNALLEQLSAVETLGSTSVILTDKTGTLTENRMTVTEVVVADASSHPAPAPLARSAVDVALKSETSRLLTAAALCSDASIDEIDGQEVQVGDPMEVALLRALDQAGLDRAGALRDNPRLAEEAFDPEIKMMATLHRCDAIGRVIVKGAPEAVMTASSHVSTGNGAVELDRGLTQLWRTENQRLASAGLRTLAVAEKTTDSLTDPYRDLVLLGLVGLSDPPRSEVAEAIRHCRSAGIEVVMVTGDQGPTADHVAAAVGLIEEDEKGRALTGTELEELLEEGEPAVRTLRSTRVFARSDPRQKLGLLSFLQGEGEVVAMIGDGVNDAPALQKSDIGIAMGKRGTQVAQEAADMILRDDRFATIVVAVRQGRIIFRNIRSFVFYLLSCNLSEIMTVGLAAALNTPLPILPMQILFLNLVTDVFPALALGVGEAGPEIMETPPRPRSEALLTSRHWARLLGYGVLMSVSVLSGLAIALIVFDMEAKRAVTVSFLILAGAQLGHVFNMVSPRSGFVANEVTRNPWVWAALVLCVGLLFASVYAPVLSEVLGTEPPGRDGWMLVLSFSLVPVLVGQGLRAVSRMRAMIGAGARRRAIA
ncbi:MAG: cation-transporting P-type ATPase [Myxococcota bacterium]